MSYINDIRLVGQLVEKPQIKTSNAGKKYAILKMQTGRPVKRDGKKHWVFSQHRVICFKQDALSMIESKGDRQVWMKVYGELGYLSGGNTAQIVVNDDHGSIGLMFADVWPETDISDEEFALVSAAADASGSDDDGQTGASSRTQEEIDDEIPF